MSFRSPRPRYLLYGEAGLLPKPRLSARPDRRLPAPLVDQIVAYAVEHPTEGPRTIAARLALRDVEGRTPDEVRMALSLGPEEELAMLHQARSLVRAPAFAWETRNLQRQL